MRRVECRRGWGANLRNGSHTSTVAGPLHARNTVTFSPESVYPARRHYEQTPESIRRIPVLLA